LILPNFIYYPAGLDPDHMWQLSSSLKRFNDQFTLVKPVWASRVARETEVTRSVAEFFDDSGTLAMDQFERCVSRLHDALGADKKSK
uniref:Signal peptidase complex subunit 2 n=1 Tax=Neogobius melanostomus TaxID=47308 RepID=A0A8C6V616_9GOBI